MSEPSDNNLSGMFDDFEHKAPADLFDKIQGKGAPVPGEFSAVFAEYAHAPSSGVWTKIERALYPKKRRAVIWWSVAAGLAVILATSLFWNLNTSNNIVRPNNISSNDKFDYHHKHDENVSLYSKNDHFALVLAENDEKIETLKGQNTTNKPKNNDTIKLEHGRDKTILSFPTIAKSSLLLARVENLLPNLFHDTFNRDSINWDENPPAQPKTPYQSEQYLMANVSPNFGRSSDGVSDLFFVNASAPAGLPSQDASEIATIESSSTYNYSGRETDQAPITIGGDFEFSLSKRWSASIGLSYSILRSSSTLIDTLGTMSVGISRNYVGVPLGIKYRVIGKRKTSGYLRATLSPEFGIKQKEKYGKTTNGYSGARSSETGGQREFAINGLQYGAALATGINYKLGQSWNLYGEVSAKSYFYQSHYNSYSNQKFWPGIKLGISYNL
jgi:hypothetical protein